MALSWKLGLNFKEIKWSGLKTKGGKVFPLGPLHIGTTCQKSDSKELVSHLYLLLQHTSNQAFVRWFNFVNTSLWFSHIPATKKKRKSKTQASEHKSEQLLV